MVNDTISEVVKKVRGENFPNYSIISSECSVAFSNGAFQFGKDINIPLMDCIDLDSGQMTGNPEVIPGHKSVIGQMKSR